MNGLEELLWQSTIELSLLLGVILFARYIIRKTTKNYNAYLLWLVIPLGLLIAKLVTQIDFSTPPSQTLNYLVGSYVVRPTQALSDWSNLLYLWLIVSELLLLRLIWQHIDLRRNLSLITAKKNVCVKSKYPVVAIDKKDFSPAVYGFIKPKIYFPIHLLEKLSQQQIELIIKHEEHHIKQKHLWLNLLWDILVCLMWFNPLVYISRQSFRHDQELFCDYLVLNKSSQREHQSYGHALLTTVSATHSVSLLCSWKMFNQLEERIMNIKKPTSAAGKLSLLLGGLAIISCTSLYAISWTQVAKKSASETLSFTQEDNGDSKIRWDVDNKTYVEENGKRYMLEGISTRQMTEQERREFEQAIENAEKRKFLSEKELRKAERQIERAQRDIELSQRDMERHQQEIERTRHKLERAYASGRLSEAELATMQESLSKAKESLQIDRETIRRDLEKARHDLERARLELDKSNSSVNAPYRALLHEVPAAPRAHSPTEPAKPVAPVIAEKLYKAKLVTEAVPTKTFPPKYPIEAVKNNTSGHVTFKFDVDEQGKPLNIKVIDSIPKDVFDSAALAVIKKWEFMTTEEGLKDMVYQLDFVLE
ncbi:MAG: TonB family protein [Kangiellaceae bacterium]|nr:TonB family protein [Kangiellaceae bacterium]